MADEISKSSPEIATGDSGIQETTTIELWGKARPQLEKALGYYDKLDTISLADQTSIIQPSTWFGQSKASYQQELDQIIDAVLRVLEASGAGKCREGIRTLQQAVKQSHQHIVGWREQMVSAPPRALLAFPQSVWTKSAEDLQEAITAEEHKIGGMRQQIAQLKDRFRSQLQQVGIEVFNDYLLTPITKDDFVTMAGVVTNVAALTAQLERLTEETQELPDHTRRYYGMYLLLVYSIDRVQTRFIQEIDHVHLPKLPVFEKESRQNIADAKKQIANGGPKDQLQANIETAKHTIDACNVLASVLREQQNVIAAENRQTKLMLGAAMNTYKTVRLSMNVAELIRDCREAFGALRGIHLPQLRTFQNLQLKGELQRLVEQMRSEGS